MIILSANIDALAQKLAQATGEPLEIAIERALEERLAKCPPVSTEARNAALTRFFDRVSAMPVFDARPADEILGYGDDGLPGS